LDESTAIQTWIDAHKGQTLLIKNAMFTGVLLSGSTYDRTRLIVRNHTLSVRPSSVSSNFGGSWVGLIFQSCDGCSLDYEGNGQRSLQPDEEHCHLTMLCGVTNFQLPRFIGREIRGDGMYVTQSNPAASSATTTGLQIGFFGCYNSADDGRNALSLIAYDGVSIGTFESIKVGAVVGGVRQPGGLDVEPNQSYQTCTGLTIGAATVRSAGTTCFGVQGKDAGSENYCVTGLFVGALDSICTLGASASDGTWALNLFQVNDVQIRGRIGHTINTQGVAGRVDSALGVVLDLNFGPCNKGLIVGENGWVRKFDIKVNIRNYSGATGIGVRACGVSDGRFSGHISGASVGAFAVQVRSNSRALTQTNVTYSIDVPKDAATSRGYRNEPTDVAAFSNCEIANCRVTGYSTWTTGLDGFGVAGMRKLNITGMTAVTIMPTDGSWTVGDIVYKTNGAKDANNMTTIGWYRLTTGTGAVSGTDWAIMNVSHVSPAV
jgi:hypothetical protein